MNGSLHPTSRILAVGDPADASEAGLHRLAPHDVAGLPGKPGRARAAAVSGGDVRVMLVHEAGHEGFRPARRLAGEDPEVVVRGPASLEAVRRRRKAKTDRIDARRTVRALRARDGGDRDAMSPVRVPTVAEEDAKRPVRRRERLVRERLRLASAVAGPLRLHGVPPGDPARKGCRARLEGMRTGCGAGLPPGVRAEIAGIPGRLEPVVAELRTVAAEKAAVLRSAREARDGPAEDGVTGAMPAAVPAHARRAAVPVRTGGSARTTRCCRGPGPSAATSATGASGRAWPVWRRGRAAPSTATRAPARPAARCCAGIRCRWPGAGCGTGPAARCRSGSRAMPSPGTDARASAGSWRWPGSFRWPCAVRHDRAGARGRGPVAGLSPDRAGKRQRKRRDGGDRTPGRPDGALRGSRAGRVTVPVPDSPHPAAPSTQTGPAPPPERRDSPNGHWGHGSACAGNRTG